MILFPFGVRNNPDYRYPGIRAARPNFFSTNTPGGGSNGDVDNGGGGDGDGVILGGEFVGYPWTQLINTADDGGGVNTIVPADGLPYTQAGAYSLDFVTTNSPFEIDIDIGGMAAAEYRNVAVTFVPEQAGNYAWNISNPFVLGFYIDGSDMVHIHLVDKDGVNQVSQSLAGCTRIRFHADGTDLNNNLVVTMTSDDFLSTTPLGTYSVVSDMGEVVIVKLMYIELNGPSSKTKVLYRVS